MSSSSSSSSLPTRLGDESAVLSGQPVAPNRQVFPVSADSELNGLGAGDTRLIAGFLSESEADSVFETLQIGGEIEYQQWYHMPHPKHRKRALMKLRRIKAALATPTADGLIPLYRFPVNDQRRYGEIAPMTPTIERLRQRVEQLTGVHFNHSVVLLYRDGDDCIGFHKDKTLDLADDTPVASISLGAARPYVLRDSIHTPTTEQEFVLPHGALLLLGPRSNDSFYHAVRALDDHERSALSHGGVRVSITFRSVATFKDQAGVVYGKGAEHQTINWPEGLNGDHRLDLDLDAPLQPLPSTDHSASSNPHQSSTLPFNPQQLKALVEKHASELDVASMIALSGAKEVKTQLIARVTASLQTDHTIESDGTKQISNAAGAFVSQFFHRPQTSN